MESWSNHPRKRFLLCFPAKVDPVAEAMPGVFGIIRKCLKDGKCINAQVFAGLFALSVTGPLVLFFLRLAALKRTTANLEMGNRFE